MTRRILKKDKKEDSAYSLVLGAAKLLAGKSNTEKLRVEILNSGHPVGLAVIRAMDTSLDKLKFKRNHDFLKAGIVYITHKALRSTSYRHIFFEFLSELKKELNAVDLNVYQKPPKEWTINKGAAIVAARQKRGK